MAKPFASVLIDTYNHERFIEEAVVSALEQDFPASEREIIVIDDGSTDRTPGIVRKFEPKVRLLRKPNGGQASAFNVGIPECAGEIIAFLDGDDWWERRKLSAVCGKFESDSSIAAVGHGLYEVDENGKRWWRNVPDRTYLCRLQTAAEARQFRELMSFLGTSRLAMRVQTLKQIIPVPAGILIEADEFLATMATAFGGSLVIDLPLTNYRLHPGNLYQSGDFSPSKIEKRQLSLSCLAAALHAQLSAFGASSEVMEILTKPISLDATRSRLSLGHGYAWESVRVERAAYSQQTEAPSCVKHAFRLAVLSAAVILPPKFFYRVRRWYSGKRSQMVRRESHARMKGASLTIRTAYDRSCHD